MMRTLVLALLLSANTALAREADVVDVKVRRNASGTYDFDVSVKSVDKGWNHYADAFEVIGPDGTVLGRRVLLHPHETEQPFTRDLYGVRIPAGVTQVTVRARHEPKGYDGETMTVRLPRRGGSSGRRRCARSTSDARPSPAATDRESAVPRR